jgi:hypothetical protein
VKNKALALVAFLFAVVALLAFLIQDYVRELLIYPLVYLYWSLRLVYEGVPGVIWWGLAIALLLLLALKSLSRREPRLQPAEEFAGHSLSRPQSWMQRIKKTRHGDYFKWQLAREIGQLALASIANHERLTLEQAREKLSTGQLDLPAPIHAYLSAGALSKSYGHYTQTESQLRLPGTTSPIDLDPQEIVSYLESRLELT